MEAVDLAVYADRLAAERTLLAARLDRCRARLAEAAIEREAAAALDPRTVALLRVSGLLAAAADVAPARAQAAELRAALGALELLQAWVERRLAGGGTAARSPPSSRRRSSPSRRTPSTPPPFPPPRAR